MDTIYDLIVSRRTIRQFRAASVPRDLLERIIDAGRLAPSAANLQPLEFVLVDDKAVCEKIFPCLKWAAYIAPAGTPAPGHEPAAYVVVLANTEIKETDYKYDVGASVENMIIAALGEGVGGCWLISIDRERIKEILKVPETHKIDSVLALGYPDERPQTEEHKGSPKYWKDAGGTLHVPKRKLQDVIHYNRF